MRWQRGLYKPRPDRFLELLIQQAEYAVEANELLLKYLKKASRKAGRSRSSNRERCR